MFKKLKEWRKAKEIDSKINNAKAFLKALENGKINFDIELGCSGLYLGELFPDIQQASGEIWCKDLQVRLQNEIRKLENTEF